MAEYTQEHRQIAVTTPLGPDKLLLVGFSGREAISRLFQFQLDVLAENETEVPFDQLLGQKITLEVLVPGGEVRYLNGICNRVSQGKRDFTFTAYHLEIVPQLWLLTKRAQSRIFQQMTVPDILKKVLTGLDVAYEMQGTFHPRDYCVQYRETDFNFASRLMEEEGICYFFKHSANGHTMVLANTPQSHPDVPQRSQILYEELAGGEREEDRVYEWEKVQELRSGKYTLWDHCFELPHKHLEAEKTIQPSVQAGEVTHQLQVGRNEQLEIYDYPGEYAQRFDGVDRGGGDRSSDLQKIFEDNKRTVDIRMQEEAMPSVQIQGNSTCRQFVTGHKFILERHFNADGQYLLTSVAHSAYYSGDYRSGQGGELTYHNTFSCIPFGLPFRPQRTTPKPFVQGTQTGVVVGPRGQEIFTDKYGRVKVQFHWDREGQYDEKSSCWIRVGQVWAGKRWGGIFIPRIGQEVVVAFQEGDPDQPIVVGSVYNAEQMPAYLGDGPDGEHPHDPNLSGIKTNTTPGGQGFNEIRFDDTKDQEQLFLHAERNMDVRVKNDAFELVEHDKHLRVTANKKDLIGANSHIHVQGNRLEKVDGSQSLTVGASQNERVGMKHAVDAGQEIHLKAGMNVVVEGGLELTIKAAGGFIKIDPSGITIQGILVRINSGGAPGVGSGSNPATPEDADEADNAVTGSKSAPS